MFDFLNDYAKEKEKEEKSTAGQSPEEQAHLGAGVFVLSVGGSLFFDDKPLTSKIAKFAGVLNRLEGEGKRFAIVVGGGKPARSYVACAKSLGATNYAQDELGIMITRANALVFIQALEKSHKQVITSPVDAISVLEAGKIPVFGGLIPSFTTDAVAALVAEALGGDFVNLTDVDGVYSADPKKSKNAKLFGEASYDRVLSLVKNSKSKPGQNFVLDLPCINILKRSSIRGIVLNGNDLENFESFINGQNFRGTVIQSPVAADGLEEVE